MKRAILSVTTGGLKTAQSIQKEMGGDIFTLEKYCPGTDYRPIRTGLKEFMGGIFGTYRELILVMSCGIAVRSIAPYLDSKLTDPAVVVLDERGNFCISLLSGHLGGANQLAEKVASITGGIAVITTASDNLGLESVDMIAKKYHFVMEDMEQVKRVTSCLVNGKKVVLVNDSPIHLDLSLERRDLEQVAAEQPDAVIYVGNKEELGWDQGDIFVAKLRVPNLVLGIGCRKGMDGEKLRSSVRAFFHQHNLALCAVKAIATVDVKKDEPAILGLAEQLAVPLCIVDRGEILPIEKRFACSDFVKKTIGVGCVCEPAAFIVSGQGKLRVPKTALEGITLCIYEERGNEIYNMG
ncbi:cobalt-precorrin 5A hydrolase [Candidatus Formimonas warabiya]|uniref:cobalt-precorrin 5A hydrolase n=1 Tax=Formimonas warabiya TaxID=1761012 RepID=UPI0011D082B5|nr:cobalt-precorrin 5A hydrolase [Candidatus Formimonas warabiya]